ncbi:MAG TPA: hypothetical protein VGJ92_05810 [Methanocella sp.]|jgi:hypothetical protein
MEERKGTGKMTVGEAGRKGGEKVRRLIEEGERNKAKEGAKTKKR